MKNHPHKRWVKLASLCELFKWTLGQGGLLLRNVPHTLSSSTLRHLLQSETQSDLNNPKWGPAVLSTNINTLLADKVWLQYVLTQKKHFVSTQSDDDGYGWDRLTNITTEEIFAFILFYFILVSYVNSQHSFSKLFTIFALISINKQKSTKVFSPLILVILLVFVNYYEGTSTEHKTLQC